MKISKLNEVYLKIDTDDGLAKELECYFTFEVPGAKFMPAVKKRRWDGKVRLFSSKTGKIYVGLLSYIKEFCERNDLEYEVEKGIENEQNISREDVLGFIQSLKPKSRGQDLQVRDYQVDAVHSAIQKHRGLFLSPTASGKSLIIYSLVRYYNFLVDKRILILVPTTSLVEQMYSDFIDYGWHDKYIHRIYAGHELYTDKPVIVSTWQSLYKLDKEYFQEFDCIIGDEAHLFKSKSLTSIMTRLLHCRYRFGLTGTLDGSQTHRLVLEGLFGKVQKITSTKNLMDKKTLAQLNINCIVLKHTDEESKEIKDFSYAEEIDYLVSNARRNKFITNLCENLSGNTLCLFQLVEKHGVVLHQLMKELDRKVFFVYGGVDAEERESIREIVEGQKNAIIIASYGTFSTGINIRNLSNIVFSSPSKSRIRVLQSIGRGLRRSEHKDSTTLYDIADDLTYREKRNFTLNHFLDRLNIYNEEQFNYQIDRIKL